jgi:MFS family permease
VTSELRAEPGEAWTRNEGRDEAQTAHPGRHRRAPEARSSYREVFAIGQFRALWSAQVLSFAGDQFAQVAIAILIYGRTHSPFLTAVAYALTYLPPIAGGPLLSGLADLFPRRRVMIVCDLFRVATVGLMAIPSMPFAALCVLLFCTVLTGVPFLSARAALMPDVLPGDTFVLGSAVGNITYQASQILGFVAGAVVVAVLDPHKTLGIDAVTFGLSALIALAGVRSRPAPGRPGTARASLWSVSAGVRIVFGSRLLLTLLLFGWLAGFYIVPEGLAAPYARSLHGNALTVGLLMAAVPLGMVIGAFLISRIAVPSARIRMMGWLAVLSCAPLIGSAWSPRCGPCWRCGRWPARAAHISSPRPPCSCRRCAPTPGPARSAWPSPACMPSRASASWPAARWRSWSAPRSPSAWPAWSA